MCFMYVYITAPSREKERESDFRDNTKLREYTTNDDSQVTFHIGDKLTADTFHYGMYVCVSGEISASQRCSIEEQKTPEGKLR